MGALGTNLNIRDTTKIVIVQVVDNDDCYEIAHVYGNNEDFDVLCRFPLNMPMRYSREHVEEYLKKYGNHFPVYTCQISHKKDVMSKEDAFAKILNAVEPWD